MGSRVWQETPTEGQRTYRPKHCEYNNKDADNCPKTLNNKNHQALSQKFWPLIASRSFQCRWGRSKQDSQSHVLRCDGHCPLRVFAAELDNQLTSL